MTSRLNQYLHDWIEKIEENIKNFKSQEDTNDDEKLEFISHQYHLVMLIHRALNGQVIFVGAKPPNKIIKKNKKGKKHGIKSN